MSDRRTILGLGFFMGDAPEAVKAGLGGGLVTVPSAPVLNFLQNDSAHRDAMRNSDVVITDSGAMVLIWRLLTGEKLIRVSGLEYVKLLLQRPDLRVPDATLWVMPYSTSRDRNLAWLKTQGYPTTVDHCYVAPKYPASGPIEDPALLSWLRERRPKHLIVALGGCTQERLGWYVRQNLDFKPGIHCIGAAIGFLTGDQVNIPKWADRHYLGWFIRCLSQPSKFVPRYWEARKLIPLMLKYRERLPELRCPEGRAQRDPALPERQAT